MDSQRQHYHHISLKSNILFPEWRSETFQNDDIPLPPGVVFNGDEDAEFSEIPLNQPPRQAWFDKDRPTENLN